jgi:hypothetical protein
MHLADIAREASKLARKLEQEAVNVPARVEDVITLARLVAELAEEASSATDPRLFST